MGCVWIFDKAPVHQDANPPFSQFPGPHSMARDIQEDRRVPFVLRGLFVLRYRTMLLDLWDGDLIYWRLGNGIVLSAPFSWA